MFHKTLFFACFCSLLLFSACIKQETEPTPLRKILSVIDDNETKTREYDAQNRITRIVEPNGNYAAYSYDTSEIILTYVLSNGQSYVNKMALNQDGYVTEWYYNTGALFAAYEYDTEGYLIREKNYSNGNLYNIDENRYYNGNLMSKTSTNASGVIVATASYEYYNSGNTLSNEHLGMMHFGKSSKNLQKSMLRSNVSNNTNRVESIYELDDSGLVKRELQLLNNSGLASSKTIQYTYE